MTTPQLEYSVAELLADDDVAEPLIAGGVRCHGGFDADGRYRSPRGKFRRPAIAAWEQHRVEQFGTPVLDVPLESWPENFPSVAQSKFLLAHGIRQPTIAALTRIGIVEGFGGVLRQLPVPDFRRCFEEDVTGTAISHIEGGLFEAHARDEAGHGDQAGHSRMWFAARDLAFGPQGEGGDSDQLRRHMQGAFSAGSGAGGRASSPAPAAAPAQVLPHDVDPVLEHLVTRMIGLLLIEISAFHGFRWAESVLSDTELVDGAGEAALLVSYIRADETPHVDWLRTALSEMRDRTWVGEGGQHHPGTEMVGRLWQRAIDDSRTVRRRESVAAVLRDVEQATAGVAGGADLFHEMLQMGPVRRLDDGTVVDARTVSGGEGGG